MIKRLRNKMIFVSMVSLISVLVLLMGTIAILNYLKILNDADNTLSILEQNNGQFPLDMHTFKPGEEKGIGPISPELPFESRYFFVLLDSNGAIKMVNTGRIAAVDTETAISYAQQVYEAEDSHGFVGQYRYLMTNKNNGVMVLFLDCGRTLDSFRMLIFSTLSVSLAGVLLVFLLLVALSKRIVKPFSDNFEKQKRFITDAGHELKTPLTIIDANTEILSMDYGENEWLLEIQNQTKRLATLTNDLIYLSRMEEVTSKNRDRISISKVLEESLDSFEAVAKYNNRIIEKDICADLYISADKNEICKLITILVDNAIKYSVDASVISCKLVKQKHSVVLTVYNKTEYITHEQVSRLFDRFYRVDESRNTQSGGYGLGLSIAMAIVNANSGHITASTLDQHSLTISVSFPAC